MYIFTNKFIKINKRKKMFQKRRIQCKVIFKCGFSIPLEIFLIICSRNYFKAPLTSSIYFETISKIKY